VKTVRPRTALAIGVPLAAVSAFSLFLIPKPWLFSSAVVPTLLLDLLVVATLVGLALVITAVGEMVMRLRVLVFACVASLCERAWAWITRGSGPGS